MCLACETRSARDKVREGIEASHAHAHTHTERADRPNCVEFYRRLAGSDGGAGLMHINRAVLAATMATRYC